MSEAFASASSGNASSGNGAPPPHDGGSQPEEQGAGAPRSPLQKFSLRSVPPSVHAAPFLVVDAAALFATLLLLFAAEDGAGAAARVLLLAPLASPGAAVALHLAQRDRRIAGIRDADERVKDE